MPAFPGLPGSPGPTDPDPGVELLERALGYTRGMLATVTRDDLCEPTPCDLWRLGDLLGHMEDSLDAFVEGAGGSIGLHSAAPTPLAERLATIQTKACALLGAWASARTPVVVTGGRLIPVAVVARLAAVEIAVHGWDVGRATGRGTPLPESLAADLLPFATGLASSPAQVGQFAPPHDTAADAPASVRLLAVLGRSPAGP